MPRSNSRIRQRLVRRVHAVVRAVPTEKIVPVEAIALAGNRSIGSMHDGVRPDFRFGDAPGRGPLTSGAPPRGPCANSSCCSGLGRRGSAWQARTAGCGRGCPVCGAAGEPLCSAKTTNVVCAPVTRPVPNGIRDEGRTESPLTKRVGPADDGGPPARDGAAIHPGCPVPGCPGCREAFLD